MKKKRIIIITSCIVAVTVAITGILIKKEPNSPPNGSLLDSYNHIQGSYDTNNLSGLSRLYIEKTSINYGKETTINKNRKSVEAIIALPDIAKIFEKIISEFAITEDLDMETASAQMRTLLEKELSENNFPVIEKKLSVIMEKENGCWNIVPDDAFCDAISGDLFDFLERQSKALGGDK